jgi:YidC/Oxa1 family membrane protein insertase
MDFQRFLLIASSAAITLLLLIEWNAFKAERVIEPERQRVAEQETQTPVLAAETNLDTVVSSVEELPSVDSESTATPVSDKQSSQRYVTVTTDLLELVIDLNGGDVIETALLDYPDNIDTPDVPFVLLEQNSLRTYTAQSGLVGPDGIDSSSRAVFDSDAMSYQMQPGEPLKITHSQSAGGNVTNQKTFYLTPAN